MSLSKHDDEKIQNWKQELLLGVVEFGTLVIRYPVSSIITDKLERLALQRSRFINAFSRVLTSADRALVFGIENKNVVSRDLIMPDEIFVCREKFYEIIGNVDEVQKCNDFFIDRSRACIGLSESEFGYSSYQELVCCYSKPLGMPIGWIAHDSLWNLGARKSPCKGMAKNAKRFIEKAIAEGEVVVRFELSIIGTYAVFHIPLELRVEFVNRILDLGWAT